jgi:3-oxoacyl-[acyl-carrier protein] reductase
MNRNVLVTGGARDIGRAVCLKFAEAGYNVIINYYHSDEKAHQTLEEVQSFGVNAVAVKADLTTQLGIDKLFAELSSNFNEIYTLVNNTGGLVERRQLDKIDSEFIDQVFNLNFKSTVLTTKALMPYISSGGSVINLSSQAARDGGGNGSSLYAASKAAISSFTRSMAKEFGSRGIRVNAVCPGMTNTLFHDTFTPDGARAGFASSAPVGREGTPMEIAELIYFLASGKASFITGSNYDINGGIIFS